tara:strand:+ start:306 stop:530 length:225 start_codon:yes stop_codon:yes gene_type:complete
MKFYSTNREDFFVKRDKLKEYEHIHYYITQNFSKIKSERDVIEIEIDGELVCRLPLLILCANYLSFEALGKVEK